VTKAVLPGADDAPGILDIDAIAAVDDIGSEVVPMPEWGGSVPLKALTAAERVAAGQRVLRELKAKGNDYANGRLAFHIVAASMVDANGDRLADPMAAAEVLASKQYGPVNRLYEVAERLSGIGDTELEKRVEALGKAHPSAGSPTD
jgi:hypothetical protein